MKKRLLAILLLFPMVGWSNEPKYEASDFINISGTKNWMSTFSSSPYRQQLVVSVFVELGIDDVRTVFIEDMNAKAGLCGADQLQSLEFLSFRPAIGKRRIQTRISRPCINWENHEVVLRLKVRTENDKWFVHTNKLTVNRGAYDQRATYEKRCGDSWNSPLNKKQ